jgi:hypothetical protein
VSEFLLDKYYDLTCEHCSRTRSESYAKGKHHDKHDLVKQAYTEGWRVVDDKNVCPICHKLASDPTWKSIGVIPPPVVPGVKGIGSKTEKKYYVLTKEGHVVQGYIYENGFSCSGYAVYLGGDDYINNVTHWVPDESV